MCICRIIFKFDRKHVCSQGAIQFAMPSVFSFFFSTIVLCGSALLAILIKMMVINLRVFMKTQQEVIQATLFSSRLKGGSCLLIRLF